MLARVRMHGAPSYRPSCKSLFFQGAYLRPKTWASKAEQKVGRTSILKVIKFPLQINLQVYASERSVSPIPPVGPSPSRFSSFC